MYKALAAQTRTLPVVPGKEEQRNKDLETWDTQVKKYEDMNMPSAKKKVDSYQQEYDEQSRNGALVHHRADRLDVGELGLQLGVVLASLAILTRRRAFWYIGLLCAALGFGWAMTGYFD